MKNDPSAGWPGAPAPATRARRPRTATAPRRASDPPREGVTVLSSYPMEDLPSVRERVLDSDAGLASVQLGLIREAAPVQNDEPRLLTVVARYAFRAFPLASNLGIAVVEDDTMRVLLSTAPDGSRPRMPLSGTIVDRVLDEGTALLFIRAEELAPDSPSIVMARMESAICVPLAGPGGPFGILQLDIRQPAPGLFTRRDLDRLTAFGGQVSLLMESLRLHQQQQRAFQSTINALLHSLTLKDPDTTQHSQRVKELARALGRTMNLEDRELALLEVAALLHDLGKQGVRDEVLFKPDRLTPVENGEMGRHAEFTQDILNMIEYPVHLKLVPLVAAYHHERMDGTGPFGIPGAEIPLASRIISVVDAYDALISRRAYREALPHAEAIRILEEGAGTIWDAAIVARLKALPPVDKAPADLPADARRAA